MNRMTLAAPQLHGGTNDPEAELMLRVQRDEAGAFSELIDRYWSRMFGRFYRQLGDRQEAEDLTQEVFLRLYRNRKRYVPSARFTTWLYHIADNVARNALRTRRRRPLHPMPWLTRSECEGGSHEDKLVDSDAIPSQPVEQAELIEVVRDAVARLADRQRSAVEMQFQECSYQEIASELDLSPQAAKSLLYRARHQLRESLSEYAVG